MLDAMEFISDVWEKPPDGHLRIFIVLPRGVNPRISSG